MIAFLRNRKFREVLLQALVISVVAATLVMMVINMRTSLEEQSMTSGFGFLTRATGWDFSFSVLEYSISDTYSKTLLIGFLNTLLLGLLGISFATLIGLIVGLVRTSKNYLFSLLGTIYVEIFRNIPLILQAVFWYSIVVHLPRPKQAYSLGDSIFFTGRGVYLPMLNISLGSVVLIIATIVAGIFLLSRLRGRFSTAAAYKRVKWLVLAVCFLLILMVAYIGHTSGSPLVSMPSLKGLNFKGGLRMPTELTALVIAIALYGGAYIGEVVRAGLMAVPRGQVEAAFVMGLKPAQVFTRIRLPLAVRAVLPSLTNQYVQLMKATTIGLVVGFSDFFMIVSTSINQSGQTLELLAILMGGFLVINLSIAYVMNSINRKIALKGYEVKA